VTVDVGQRVSRRPRYLYPGFVASLALNLLFVGGLAAAAWHHHNAHARTPEPGLLGFVRELSPDRQDVVREEITAAREAMKDQRNAVRKVWLDTNALLTAEPFDKAKFKAALASLATAEAGYKSSLNDALAETADTLKPDERKLLQVWREKRRPWLLLRNSDQSKNDSKSD